MTKLDFPKIIKTTTLTKLSHGEVKWISTPTQIRASEFENIVPSIYGQTEIKAGFEKCRFRKFRQTTKIRSKTLNSHQKSRIIELQPPEFRKKHAKFL